MKPDLRACFIGDSNLGVRRDTAADAAARADAELACRLRLGDRFAVVIAVGTNDVSLGVPLPVTLLSVERLIISAGACGATAVVLSPPVMGLDKAADTAARDMTAAIAEVCVRAATPFLDLRQAVADWDLWWREAAAGDGAHPNGDGYALVADAVSACSAWRAWLSGG
jgi:lysophospholipase L1-like esterase